MSDPRIEDLLAEIVELRESKAALQVEIDRLRALNDDQQETLEKILAGTKRRETEYEQMIYDSGFKLGEAHTEIKRLTLLDQIGKRQIELSEQQVRRLEAERHTTKQLLEDVLEKYGVGSKTPHYGVGRGGLKE